MVKVRFNDQPIQIRVEGAALASRQAALAQEAAESAQSYASAAEAFAGPTFPDAAAGLAGTTDGQSFAVNDGGIVTVYLNDGGSAVEQRRIATTAALASPEGAGGAQMVTYSPPDHIHIPRPLSDYLGEALSVFESGEARSAFENGTKAQYAINDMLQRASAIASATGHRPLIRIPGIMPRTSEGDYLVADWRCEGGPGHTSDPGEIKLASNIIVDARGAVFKLFGNVGHLVVTRGPVSDMDWYGGDFDANFQGNDNPIALGSNDPGPGASNIMFKDFIVRNARHGGAHIPDPTDPTTLGNGGGKGFVIHFNCRDVKMLDFRSIDCDIGFSVQGQTSDQMTAHGIQVSRGFIEGSRYVGALLWASQIGAPDGSAANAALLSDLFFQNCANGKTIDAVPSDVADLFGVLTLNGAIGFKGENIFIQNTSGKTTILRGTGRLNTIRGIEAHIAGELADVRNSKVYGGTQKREIHSYGNTFEGSVRLLGSAPPSGFVHNNDATNQERNSTIDFKVLHYGHAAPQAWPVDKVANNVSPATHVRIEDTYSAAGSPAPSKVYEYINGQLHVTPDIGIAAAPDTVITYRPRNRASALVLTVDDGTAVHTAIVSARLTRVTKVVDPDDVFAIGNTVLTSSPSDGVDNKYNIHFNGEVWYFKNMLPALNNVVFRELP